MTILQYFCFLCRSCRALASCSFSVQKEMTVHQGKIPHILTKHSILHELRTVVKYYLVTGCFLYKQFYTIKSTTRDLWVQQTCIFEAEYPRYMPPCLKLWSCVRKKNSIIIMLFSTADRGFYILRMLLRCLNWEQKDVVFLIK